MSIDDVKMIMRDVMMYVMLCEDNLIVNSKSSEERTKIRREFENLRRSLMKIYVRSIRRLRGKILSSNNHLPSELKPEIAEYEDKASAWIKHIDKLLENYEAITEKLKEGSHKEKQ